MIGVTCKYAPVELLAGFGETTERLDPAPADFNCAESCTHPNMCSFGKAIIEEVKKKHITELVMTDCCDASRRVYDVLKKDPQMKFIWLLPLPHKNGETEISLFEEDLKKLCEAYEKYSGKTFDASLAKSAYHKQHQNEPKRPDGEYINILGAHGGKQLFEAVQAVFPEVPVVDDTCSANRYLRNEEGEARDFFDWYAEALLNQEMPCMRMWKNAGRTREGNQPIGTVFHTIKFCDYYGFEYMLLKDAGHMIKIETDTTAQSSGQLKTRLEAFREELGFTNGKKNTNKIGLKKYYVAGIDSGSASTDAVIMDNAGKIVSSYVKATGAGSRSGAEEALAEALKKAGLQKEDLISVVSTGYGRHHIGDTDESVTEISCHARGAHYLDPSVRTVIDIGGQDSKVISVDEDGHVQNFVMNDKCAAGTGRFLEMQARTMQLGMDEMSALGMKWKKDITISSMCTVFAESEVVSLIAENTEPADIVHGLNKAVASKTVSLMHRLEIRPAIMMTGGVARNAGVVKCLEEELHTKIEVSPYAQICGAIGACLFALDEQNSTENG